MKEQSQRSSNRHKKEMSVAKERLDSCLKTSQSLQSYITHLYAKLDTSSSDRSSNNTGTRSHNVTWTSSSDHKCEDKCQTSVDDLDISTAHHHHHHHQHHRHHHLQEHSHRHSLQSNNSSTKPSSASQTNPFTQKTRAATLSSTLSVDSQSSNT